MQKNKLLQKSKNPTPKEEKEKRFTLENDPVERKSYVFANDIFKKWP